MSELGVEFEHALRDAVGIVVGELPQRLGRSRRNQTALLRRNARKAQQHQDVVGNPLVGVPVAVSTDATISCAPLTSVTLRPSKRGSVAIRSISPNGELPDVGAPDP